MMTASRHQDLTLIFEIPHVNNLLVYKYNWNNGVMMRKMVAEFIDTGQFHMLYFGDKCESVTNDKYTPKEADTAIIAVCVRDIQVPEGFTFNSCKEVFITELRHNKNLFQFDNAWIDQQNNISLINISVTVRHAIHIDTAVSAA